MEEFENSIPDDSSVICVKFNHQDADEDGRSIPIRTLRDYIASTGLKILFASAGLHLNGEHKIPHVHVNFICNPIHNCKKKTFLTNQSENYKRWLAKTGEEPFEEFSMKIHRTIDLKKPKYSTLAYPLKEGHELKISKQLFYQFLGNPMTQEQIELLKSVGQTIYQTELALNLRRDKCEERKKVALTDLYKICEENKEKFNTLKEMAEFLEDEYIAKLDLVDYPDFQHYKNNLIKISTKLGKLKYCDMV